MRDIKLFVSKALLPLTVAGFRGLEEITGEPVYYCDRPVVLIGDFNVNFSLPVAQLLLDFLEQKFSLRMVNSRHYPTTKGGTTIDAVFARKLENIELKHFVSYFNYQNPISITRLTE
uniref:Endonuclease/exonuclease/phosphatase domain-containing protein n=1 Tax=Sipha flava TaxID=143950 RepID=A0A2S2QSI5_9HEMI